MSSEPAVGGGVPPIAEEPAQTAPVPPRRGSQPKIGRQAEIDAALAERRRSLVPMSSMEEENLRERLHLAQLRQCHTIVFREQKYNRDTFRRLFNSKVGTFNV